jgi:SAM-dependent methyltransferase
MNVFEIGGLRRAICSHCRHQQRVDIPSYDYRAVAMGASGTDGSRIADQASFAAPFIKPKGKVLEIGCAAGHLARELRMRLKIGTYHGVEMSPFRVDAMQYMDDVFDQPLPQLLQAGTVAKSNYDLVIISHCLEHMEDLHEIMRALNKVSSPSGSIFIEVPNRSGHPALAFDDNRAHLHFFSVSSLSRLLSEHGLEIIAARTGARFDARYPECIRVIAQSPSSVPEKGAPILSNHRLLAGVPKVVIWGAGGMSQEIIAHFFDLQRIAFFVDRDEKKQGSTCLGLPVNAPEILRQQKGQVVVINSMEYEEPIRRQIESEYAGCVSRIIGIRELLM